MSETAILLTLMVVVGPVLICGAFALTAVTKNLFVIALLASLGGSFIGSSLVCLLWTAVTA